MKVISLWQPWATLVVIGAKTFETRHWSTSYRGELGIHAAKACGPRIREIAEEEPFRSALEQAGYRGFRDLPLGALLGTTRLVSVFKTHNGGEVMHDVKKGERALALIPKGPERAFGDFTPGRYVWQLKDAIRYPEPLECRGHQGFFDVDLATLSAGRIREATPQTGLGL